MAQVYSTATTRLSINAVSRVHLWDEIVRSHQRLEYEGGIGGKAMEFIIREHSGLHQPLMSHRPDNDPFSLCDMSSSKLLPTKSDSLDKNLGELLS